MNNDNHDKTYNIMIQVEVEVFMDKASYKWSQINATDLLWTRLLPLGTGSFEAIKEEKL